LPIDLSYVRNGRETIRSAGIVKWRGDIMFSFFLYKFQLPVLRADSADEKHRYKNKSAGIAFL